MTGPKTDPEKYISFVDTNVMPSTVFASRYWKQLFSYDPTTAIAPEEWPVEGKTEDDQIVKARSVIAKLSAQLRFAQGLKLVINNVYFRQMESMMVERARELETKKIWQAIRSDSVSLRLSYLAEHTGLINFFDLFNEIDVAIQEINEKIVSVKGSYFHSELSSDEKEVFDNLDTPDLSG